MGDQSSLSVAAAALQREESFRTALRNQKRRLSATERKPSVPELGISKERVGLLGKRDSLTPPRRDSPRRGLGRGESVEDTEGDGEVEVPSKQSTPDIRLEFWDIAELSPLSTPAGSRRPSRSPSPFDLRPQTPCSRSPSPRMPRSPLPPDSPLLSPHPISPALKRAKSFNKEMRRCASFRAARDKSQSRNSSAVNSRNTSPERCHTPAAACQVSFSIKRALGYRKGWKIMADDGQVIEGSALKTVVGMIKDMEFQGFSVPERITIQIP